MRRLILIFIFNIFFWQIGFSQSKIGLKVGGATLASIDKDGKTTLGLNLLIGIDYSFGNVRFTPSFIYQYSGTSIFDFYLRKNSLGGSVEFCFFTKKRCQLYLSTSIVTEIATNYKNGTLTVYNLPINNQDLIDHYNKYGNVMFTNIHFYQKTPFRFSFIMGFNFLIKKNLNLNIGIGYGREKMKVRNGKWHKSLTLKEIKNFSLQNYNSNMFIFNLGISYTFLVHKKTKNE